MELIGKFEAVVLEFVGSIASFMIIDEFVIECISFL
ncbi:hypothetical protein M6B38_343650 [Iris pallida]|uniref:Uncharacterized protein n=1 Tax=Iris pallida TaxID=29817 RepID=A0AAX6GUM8_IRIPA|nr:hypothetical protein M6B38_343650 [Iris pallida]